MMYSIMDILRDAGPSLSKALVLQVPREISSGFMFMVFGYDVYFVPKF